jgi:hypothetical protein
MVTNPVSDPLRGFLPVHVSMPKREARSGRRLRTDRSQNIARNAGSQFDPEVVQCWMSAMKNA